MKLPTALISTLETALHQWITFTRNANAAPGEQHNKTLHKLHRKIIRLLITGLDIELFFLVSSDDTIDVMQNYTGEVDASISGSPIQLMRLSHSKKSGKTLLDSDIQIDGEMWVAQQFSEILSAANIDWEEWLSHYVGDIVAHQMGQVSRSGSGWLKDTSQAMHWNMGEYLSEEIHLTPSPAEIENFVEDVDDLRMQYDRLEARIKQLKQKQQDS